MAASAGERKSSTTNMKNATFDLAALKESLALAEIKAAAASAKKVKNIDIHTQLRKLSNSSDQSYVPPKQLLLYLVRMGSFTSIPKVAGSDNQDDHLKFPSTTTKDLLERCGTHLKGFPLPFEREIQRISGVVDSGETIRIFQWNHLSQTLGTKNDKFVKCDPSALDWSIRRWRLIEEILRYKPDIVCLQEVDHFKLLQSALGSVGYKGRFVPKPDSPCIYLPSNNGPDGCAIFYKTDQFELLSEANKMLEVWGVESNQVVMSLTLQHKTSGKEICVATTHLKARSGALLSTLRNEQGKDILEWLETVREGRPVMLTGDFNAEPSEPVYKTIIDNEDTPLQSAYNISEDSTKEDKECVEFTTWKIRETGEQKQVLDYIFHSPQLQTVSTLSMPTEHQVGEDRLPSLQFGSDHLSLVADFKLE